MRKAFQNNYLLAGLLGISLFFGSCKKELANSFTVTPQEAAFDLPVIVNATNGSVFIDTTSTSLNMDREIKNYAGASYGIDEVKSITLSGMTLILSNADEQNNFANFSSLSASVYSNAVTPTYLKPQLVATATDLSENFTEALDLTVSSNQSLTNYLRGTEVFYILEGTIRKPLQKNLNGRIHVVFNID